MHNLSGILAYLYQIRNWDPVTTHIYYFWLPSTFTLSLVRVQSLTLLKELFHNIVLVSFEGQPLEHLRQTRMLSLRMIWHTCYIFFMEKMERWLGRV